jgi:cytoskeletal protein CcmA (bactofilin family)
MFGNKNTAILKKNNDFDFSAMNKIGDGTSINGDINSNGDIRVDGSIVGIVNCKGKLILGPSGSVNGDIICANAEISGTVKGNLQVAELLNLKASAHVNGEISTGKLSIEPGANFSGSCVMGGMVKDIKNGEQRKAEKIA